MLFFLYAFSRSQPLPPLVQDGQLPRAKHQGHQHLDLSSNSISSLQLRTCLYRHADRTDPQRSSELPQASVQEGLVREAFISAGRAPTTPIILKKKKKREERQLVLQQLFTFFRKVGRNSPSFLHFCLCNFSSLHSQEKNFKGKQLSAAEICGC